MQTFEEVLAEWQKVSLELDRAKAREMELRKALFTAAFPNPVEGTNSLTLADGRIVKGVHKINRSVDDAQVPAVRAEILKRSNEVKVDDLFRVGYSLGIKEYNKLGPELLLIANKAVTAKPGAPTLEVV